MSEYNYKCKPLKENYEIELDNDWVICISNDKAVVRIPLYKDDEFVRYVNDKNYACRKGETLGEGMVLMRRKISE